MADEAERKASLALEEAARLEREAGPAEPAEKGKGEGRGRGSTF